MSDQMDLVKNEEIQEKKQQELEHENVKSTRVKDMTSFFEAEAKRQEKVDVGHELHEKLKANMVMQEDEFSETSIPMDKVLHGEYKDEYKEKSLVKSRSSKIKNKKSRLYAKDQVAKHFETYEKEEFEHRNTRARLRRTLPLEQRRELRVSELNALSVLASMKEDETGTFKNLVEKYTGISEGGEQKVSTEVKKGRLEIISELANDLMSVQFAENFNIFDDKQLSDHMEELEKNSQKLKIFTDLVKENPEFMESLQTKERDSDALAGGETAAKLNKQLERLRAVDDVYRVRKLIVTNPYYRTHYNDELSMNVDVNDHPQKKYLSKLLRTQFYLGKNLQQAMGADQDIIYSKTSLADGTAYMKKFEREVRDISKASESYDRKKVDNMLVFLEHEKGCIPPDDMMFTLEEARKKKPKSVAHMMASNSTLAECTALAKLKKLRPDPTPAEQKRRDLVESCIEPYNASAVSISVKSEKLHNHVGGDSMARQTEVLLGPLCDTLTDEEVAEMIDNLMYSHKLKNRSEKEQAMVDDMYLNGYALYTNLMHQKMKMTYNILGDKLEILRPEDWARIMSDHRMGDLMVTSIGCTSNMDVNLPYEFLKKYSDLPVDHLKDFDLLSKGISSLGIKADDYRQGLASAYADSDDCSDFIVDLRKKQADAQKRYDDLVASNAAQDQIDAAKKDLEEAQLKAAAGKGLFVINTHKNPESMITFSDLSDQTKNYVQEGIKSRQEMSHPDALLSGYLSFKKTKYWDYGITSEADKKAYWEKCDQSGYVKVKMELKEYPDDVVKSIVFNHLNSVVGLNKKAKSYGLGESETSKEDIALIRNVWLDLGFAEKEFDDKLVELRNR